MNHPILLLLLTAAALYLAHLWRMDAKAAENGKPQPAALPGATDAPPKASIIAIGGCLFLLTVETAGEYALGIAARQSTMTWLSALYSVAGAPMIEELVFRGWLVVENRGRPTLWLAAFGASLIFAGLHPFLWKWTEGGLILTADGKGWFSTAIVFATSLWLYVARLAPWNPRRSLAPCVLGHATKNLGVVLIKAATGFISGPW